MIKNGSIHLSLDRTPPILNRGIYVCSVPQTFEWQSCQVGAVVSVVERGRIRHFYFGAAEAPLDRKTRRAVHTLI
jgi:hypothetical protein